MFTYVFHEANVVVVYYHVSIMCVNTVNPHLVQPLLGRQESNLRSLDSESRCHANIARPNDNLAIALSTIVGLAVCNANNLSISCLKVRVARFELAVSYVRGRRINQIFLHPVAVLTQA